MGWLLASVGFIAAPAFFFWMLLKICTLPKGKYELRLLAAIVFITLWLLLSSCGIFYYLT